MSLKKIYCQFILKSMLISSPTFLYSTILTDIFVFSREIGVALNLFLHFSEHLYFTILRQPYCTTGCGTTVCEHTMAAPTSYALAVQFRRGAKTVVDVIGSYLVEKNMKELFEEVLVNASLDASVGNFQSVQVSSKEGGPWRDVEKTATIAPGQLGKKKKKSRPTDPSRQRHLWTIKQFIFFGLTSMVHCHLTDS